MQKVDKPKKSLMVYYLIVLAVLVIMNLFLFPALVKEKVQEVDYGTFLTMLEEKKVATVQLDGDEIYFTGKDEQLYSTNTFQDLNLVDRLQAAGCSFGQVKQEELNPIVSFLLSFVVPIIIFIGIGQLLSRSMMKKMGGAGLGNAMSFGKSNAKVYVASETGIKFKDVAGEDEAKEALQEIVDFLHSPQKYQEIGAKMPKGALLVGPPGTGKTLLAKAVAGEAEVPFFSISGSEFVEMFVGMGAAKVRDLFKQANEKAPCIVFIDEIDTIGKKRDAQGMGGNDEREQTLNQLLTEMDGFDGSKGCGDPRGDEPSGDPGSGTACVRAVLTDGFRWNFRICRGREAILKVHAKNIRLSDGVDFDAIARAASGASGAELANMINEAALRAVRNGQKICDTVRSWRRALRLSLPDIRRKIKCFLIKKS